MARDPDEVDPAVVVFLVRETANGREVLLGRKRAGPDAGCLVAPGCQVEDDEANLEVAVRELNRALGLTVVEDQLVPLVSLTISFTSGSPQAIGLTAYRLDAATLEPQSVAGGELADCQWYAVSCLPVDELSPIERVWVPPALQGNRYEHRRLTITPGYLCPEVAVG